MKPSNPAGHSIYPGVFNPTLFKTDVSNYRKSANKFDPLTPDTKITELEMAFKIEIPFPGSNREEFVIEAGHNCLSVYALHNPEVSKHVMDDQLMGCENCLEKHIDLPVNTDTECTCGEYKNGILKLYVPKSDHPVRSQHSRIIIY